MSHSQCAPASLPSLRPAPKMGLGAALIGQEEEALVTEVVRSKELFRFLYSLPPEKQGKMSSALEAEFCTLTGAKYALAVTSGTAALETALGALGVGPGDEVILAAWSWISCFTSVVRLGARPVLAEVDESLCIAPGEITRLHTSHTKAVIVVHYQGVAADMDALMAEARKLNIRVLEDCAESTGATYKGKTVGSIGDIGIYSFQYQKMITSGEGGMVVTSDPQLYERAIRFHDIGNVRDHFKTKISPTELAFSGSQFRVNELTAAVALAQVRKLAKIREHCRTISARIIAKIKDLPGITLRLNPDPHGDNGIETYFFVSDHDKATRFVEALSARNVNCNRMTGTYCHYARDYCRLGLTHAGGATPFSDLGEMPAKGYRPEDFPRTEALVSRFIAIPVGVLFTEEDADYIGDTIVALHDEWL